MEFGRLLVIVSPRVAQRRFTTARRSVLREEDDRWRRSAAPVEQDKIEEHEYVGRGRRKNTAGGCMRIIDEHRRIIDTGMSSW